MEGYSNFISDFGWQNRMKETPGLSGWRQQDGSLFLSPPSKYSTFLFFFLCLLHTAPRIEIPIWPKCSFFNPTLTSIFWVQCRVFLPKFLFLSPLNPFETNRRTHFKRRRTFFYSYWAELKALVSQCLFNKRKFQPE